MRRRAIPLVVFLIINSALCGCATTTLTNWRRAKPPVADAANPAIKVLALWQPAEGTGIDGKTCRGMVGQIYFFTRKSPIGAKVDGSVRIYLFDDQGSEEEQIKPLHQFDFPPDSWAARGQDGELGHAYSVFIPYTRKGFHEAHCGLRIRFTPSTGGFPVHSEMTYVTLPGSRKRVARPEREAEPADQEDLAAEATRRRAETTVAGLLEVAAAAKAKSAKPRIELSQVERDRIIRETREKLAREAQEQNSRLMNAERIELEIDEDEAGFIDPGAKSWPQGRNDRYNRHNLGDFRDEVEEARFREAAAPPPGRSSDAGRREPLLGKEPPSAEQPPLKASRGLSADSAATAKPAATAQIACVANGLHDRVP